LWKDSFENVGVAMIARLRCKVKSSTDELFISCRDFIDAMQRENAPPDYVLGEIIKHGYMLAHSWLVEQWIDASKLLDVETDVSIGCINWSAEQNGPSASIQYYHDDDVYFCFQDWYKVLEMRERELQEFATKDEAKKVIAQSFQQLRQRLEEINYYFKNEIN
jgi:hypothetical protein